MNILFTKRIFEIFFFQKIFSEIKMPDSSAEYAKVATSSKTWITVLSILTFIAFAFWLFSFPTPSDTSDTTGDTSNSITDTSNTT